MTSRPSLFAASSITCCSALLAALLAGGCGSSSGNNPGTDSGTNTGGHTDSGATTSGGDGGSDAASCNSTVPAVCGDAVNGGKSCVLAVKGKAVDAKGVALGGLTVSVCGDVCYIGCATAADGTFTAPIGHLINAGSYSAIAHGRPDHSNGLVPIPTTASGVLTLDTPVAAPAFDDTGVLIPVDDATTGVIAKGGDVTSGAVTLTIADGTTITYDVEELEVPAATQKHFRTAKLDLTSAPKFVTDAKVVAAWGLGPFDTSVDKKIAVKLASAYGLAAGAAVEFVALGSVAGFDQAVFVPVAKGHVSADGKTITTDAGEGLSRISWLGVRAAP